MTLGRAPRRRFALGRAPRRRFDALVIRVGIALTFAVIVAIPTTLGWMPTDALLTSASAASAGDASAAALANLDERMQGERTTAARIFAPAFESSPIAPFARIHPRDAGHGHLSGSHAPANFDAHRLSTDVLLL